VTQDQNFAVLDTTYCTQPRCTYIAVEALPMIIQMLEDIRLAAATTAAGV
jgi:hypothetical protein